MSDYAKVLEEYTRLLIAGPRSLDEMSKMGRRLSLLKAGSREKPIEIHATEEEDLKRDLKNLEEDLEDLRKLDIDVIVGGYPKNLATLKVQSAIIERIKVAQSQDSNLVEIREEVIQGKKSEFNVYGDGTLRFGDRLCVPSDGDLKKELMIEAHCTPYSVHPGSSKMFKDLRKVY